MVRSFSLAKIINPILFFTPCGTNRLRWNQHSNELCWCLPIKISYTNPFSGCSLHHIHFGTVHGEQNCQNFCSFWECNRFSSSIEIFGRWNWTADIRDQISVGPYSRIRQFLDHHSGSGPSHWFSATNQHRKKGIGCFRCKISICFAHRAKKISENVIPGEARLSKPAADDQDEHVSSFFFFIPFQVEAKRTTVFPRETRTPRKLEHQAILKSLSFTRKLEHPRNSNTQETRTPQNSNICDNTDTFGRFLMTKQFISSRSITNIIYIWFEKWRGAPEEKISKIVMVWCLD